MITPKEVEVRDATEAGDYQSLSPLAAIALVLGLLSATALASPLLLFVPAAAAGAGLLALAKIRSSGGSLTGVKRSAMGLALAVIFGVATLVRDPVRDALMRKQAAVVAGQWLNLLAEGRIDDALQLVSAQAIQHLGPPQQGPDDKPPKPEDAMIIVRSNMTKDPLTKQAATLKRPLEVTEAVSGAPVADGTRFLLAEEFVVHGAGSGPSFCASLSFVRMPVYEAQGHPWRLDSWKLLDDSVAAGTAAPQ